ncbi:MAG: winged helix-turn-helix domain-containing protein [Clostridia bacterium]
MPTIRLEADVYEALKKLAEPFTDTPSSVIRRLLEAHGHLDKLPEDKPVPAKPAADPGLEPTPQSVYEEMLLQVLAAAPFNGRGDKRSVTLAIVGKMQKQKLLRPADLELVATGETRAENAIAWSRHALKERGLLSRSSPRGVWELSAEGRAASAAVAAASARTPGSKAGKRSPG